MSNAGDPDGGRAEEAQSAAAPGRDSLISYPCAFPIKIMGRREGGFAQAVLAIVLEHAPDFAAATMEMRPSRQGKYLSLTCTINAVSREQLDQLYRDLCDHPSVVMVL